MTKILPTIKNALDLHPMPLKQLEQVADEIRETLCNPVSYTHLTLPTIYSV